MKTVRQNFILPASVKLMLDSSVPKGTQSQFVAEAIKERLAEKRSWQILEANPNLTFENPLHYAKKLRKGWKRS